MLRLDMSLSQVSVRATKKASRFLADAVHPMYHNLPQESECFVEKAIRF